MTRLQQASLPDLLMVDCSHGNSGKDHAEQAQVASYLGRLIAQGERHIAGVMLESHLQAGKQSVAAATDLVYGQSVTDSCIDFETTKQLLAELALAVRSRRNTAKGVRPCQQEIA